MQEPILKVIKLSHSMKIPTATAQGYLTPGKRGYLNPNMMSIKLESLNTALSKNAGNIVKKEKTRAIIMENELKNY